MYFIQHCFICRPSQIPLCRRMLGSNPGLLRLRHWQSDALTTRLDLISDIYDLSLIFVVDSWHACWCGVQECVAGAGAGGEGGGHGHPHQAHQEQEAARHCHLHRGQVGHNSFEQCSGTVTFWYGFGSSDPYLWLMDQNPAPDPALFVSDLQDANKICLQNFFAY